MLYAALLFGYPFGISLRDLDGQSTHALLLVRRDRVGRGRVLGVRAGTSAATRSSPPSLSIGMLVWYLASDTAPSWLPNTLPYVLVLLVLVFASQRLRPPAADGLPYRKGEH